MDAAVGVALGARALVSFTVGGAVGGAAGGAGREGGAEAGGVCLVVGGGAMAGVEGIGPADLGVAVSVDVFEGLVGSGVMVFVTFSTAVLSVAVFSEATFATGVGAGFSVSAF